MISMIIIFSMYIVHVCLGSGCNSYQGHVNDSGEFWRVLGCTRIRHHWKRDIVDTFTHNFCANRHGWIIGTSFPYIRKSERRHSSPVQYTCISSHLSWLYFTLQALLPLKPFTRWETSLLCCALCCTTHPCYLWTLELMDLTTVLLGSGLSLETTRVTLCLHRCTMMPWFIWRSMLRRSSHKYTVRWCCAA